MCAVARWQRVNCLWCRRKPWQTRKLYKVKKKEGREKKDVIKTGASVISRSNRFPLPTLSNPEYYFMRPISHDPSGCIFVEHLTALFCQITKWREREVERQSEKSRDMQRQRIRWWERERENKKQSAMGTKNMRRKKGKERQRERSGPNQTERKLEKERVREKDRKKSRDRDTVNTDT